MTATEMGLLADRDFLLTFGGEGRLRIHQKLEISVELATGKPYSPQLTWDGRLAREDRMKLWKKVISQNPIAVQERPFMATSEFASEASLSSERMAHRSPVITFFNNAFFNNAICPP